MEMTTNYEGETGQTQIGVFGGSEYVLWGRYDIGLLELMVVKG